MANKVIKEMADRVIKTAEESMREMTREAKGGSTGLEALEQLGREYDTVNVILKRRNEVTNKMELFSDQTGVLVTDLLETGYDLWCKKEGGKGEYILEVIAPPKEHGKQPQKQSYGPLHVGGAEQLPVARSEMNKLGMGGFNMWGGLPSATAGKDSGAMSSAMGAMVKQMGASANQSSNQMMGFLQMMFMEKMLGQMNPGQASAGGNGIQPTGVAELKEEVRQLRSERERDRDRNQQDERMRAMQAQVDKVLAKLENGGPKDNTLDILKLQQATNKGDDFLKYITLMREESAAGQARFDSLLMKLYERPDDAQQYSKISASMMEQSVQQLNLITQLAASGLVGGGAEKSWKDVAGEVLDTVRTAFAARYGLAGMDQDAEQPLPIEAGPTEVIRQQQPQQQLPLQQPTPQLPEQPQEPDPEDGEQVTTDPAALKSVLLTEEELDSMSRDRAASQIFKAIKEGDYHQASARIFGLAYSDHSVYQRWIQIPGPLSGQILTHFKLPEHMLALTENIGLLNEYLDDDGDPNEWSDNYKPIKPRPKPKQSQLAGSRPDFGLQQGELPTDIRQVDPSVPPPGIDPELVKQQREERSRKQMIDQMKRVRENVEIKRAGKLTSTQVAHMRQHNQLPEEAEEEQFLAESEEIIKKLEAAAPRPPTPSATTPPAVAAVPDPTPVKPAEKN